MTIVSQTSVKKSLAEAYAWVREQVSIWNMNRASSPETISRFECDVEEIDFIAWLEAQPPTACGYWSDRESGFDLAGIGRADILSGDGDAEYEALLENLYHRIAGAQRPLRYFGGGSFTGQPPTEKPWNPFGAYRFVLPRFEIEHEKGRTIFACNITGRDSYTDVMAELERLRLPTAPGRPLDTKVLKRIDTPEHATWLAMVEDALNRFRPGEYEKVVLARRTTLRCEESVSPQALLRKIQSATRQRFYFCFQPQPGIAFVGASPERLYRRDDETLQTEALAGTRPLGENDDERGRFESELRNDAKEKREHQYVADGIEGALQGLCRHLHREPEPSVLRLAFNQHLKTAFHGQLTDTTSDASLLRALHPTPALGGSPRAKALADIERLEPFERGWYGGPVGWLSGEAAQFAVGIRSALVVDNQVHLYAGAGIVDGSSPEREWDEIENKMSDFLRALM